MTSFLPYSTQHIDEDDIQAVVSVLRSSHLTQGPAIAQFETDIAQKVGAQFGVAVSNGTAALHLCCLAIGLSEGDEVITTPNTFVASANAALYCGAIPVFADINSDTGLIDVAQIEAKITPKTKAIIPVDFSGTPTDLEPIFALAKRHGLVVIQDACHSLGATYQDQVVGNNAFAHMTVFSFHPVKPLTTGEGGLITTNDPALYDKLVLLRTHGITKDPEKLSQNPGPWYYEMTALGFNYRMTDLQAALGSSQLRKLDAFTQKRQALAAVYDAAFADWTWLTPLRVPAHRTSARHLYVVKINFEAIGKTRAEVMAHLKDRGIGSQVHYAPVYDQPYYHRFLACRPNCPNMDAYYAQALSLPLYPALEASDQHRVVEALHDLTRT
ncbi:MAG: UDP-4-amino-4,6-dideoxy-N-acetyl-beta-L-altrosamine transaminase [Candidatus Margulisiibacteriota bacterium]